MKPIEKITTWEEADQALAHLALLHRELTTLAAWRDEAIQRAKSDYVKRAEPIQASLGTQETELHRFVLTHQEDLEGRSRKLEFGRVGLLLVHEVAVRSVKKAIAWLVETRKPAYYRVKYELNKETLREASPEVLKACGAKVKSRDECWYEIDGQRIAVEE